MFIPTRVHDVLVSSGIQLNALDDQHVDLEIRGLNGTHAVFEVKTWSQSIGSAVVERLAAPSVARYLLIVPTLSASTRMAIEARGWSWLTDPHHGEPEGLIDLPGREPIVISSHQHGERRPAKRGSRSVGRYAVMRRLLIAPQPRSQRDVADAAGVSQPRVSQILTGLRDEGLVGRVRGATGSVPRWRVMRWHELLDRWLDTYPGPGGVTSYWFGLDSPNRQAEQVVGLLLDGHVGHSDNVPVVSGDSGADFVAPYRRAQRAIVYAVRGADLSSIGLTPSSEDSATLALTVPADRSVWPYPGLDMDALVRGRTPYVIADVVQMIWDLLNSPGPDRDQAAEAVRLRLERFARDHD